VLLLALGALAAVVVVGIVIALAGDDDDSATGGRDDATFGPVTVEGGALPTYPGTGPDPAVGQSAPVVGGESPDGEAVAVGGDGPTLVAFLAHWCPHCQAELPVLVDLAAEGGFDGVRTVAVLTGTNADAPNFPPVPWLDREGWEGDILLDDEDATAALAYGLDGYPFLVVLDADGSVVARSSGELPAADVQAMVDAARG
jgi:thiol-disulfide isomerase/thioredoxin